MEPADVAVVARPRLARRRLVALVLVAVAMIGAAEVGARLLEERLPAPLLWHSQEALVRVENMEAVGDVDVVFAGSSIAAVGFDPTVFERHAPGIMAHNAGLSAALPSLSVPWLEHVVLPRLSPELLVIGVGSADFADLAGVVEFREAFLSSSGGRHAAEPSNIVASVDWWLSGHSALWATRRELRQPGMLLDALKGDAERLDDLAAAVRPTGWATFAGTPRFDPSSPDARTGLPAAEWRLGIREPALLRSLLEHATEQGIKVALVLMPTTEFFVSHHPNGQRDHDAYVAAATTIASELDVALLRFDDMRDDALFGDAVHLNREGAAWLTEMVVSELEARGLL